MCALLNYNNYDNNTDMMIDMFVVAIVAVVAWSVPYTPAPSLPVTIKNLNNDDGESDRKNWKTTAMRKNLHTEIGLVALSTL